MSDWSDRELDEGGRGDRAVDREIERLRAVYREHAETLSKLAAAAPTKALARKYHDLIGDINRSILGLDDPGALASRRTHDQPLEPPAGPQAPTSPPRPSRSISEIPLRTEPGRVAVAPESDAGSLGRIVLILGMAVVVIALLALFVWKFAGEPQAEPEPAATTTEAPAPEPATAPVPGLRVSPEAQDYGVVYKGTRVAKSFEVSNTSARDIPIEVERSDCRCLWFDYTPLVPSGGRVELTVAVDGGLAEPGLLSEAVVIRMKEPPRQSAEVLITAEIR